LACPTPDEVFHSAHKQELVGLAFSGGGIRSATFNLGVLQGFAELGLLPMFDYLSTVSGGGYIGGWYEAWIYRAALDQRVAQCSELSSSSEKPVSGIWRVQKCLTTDRSGKIDHSEAQALRFLREYSNYLTPRLGFLGADTWTAAAIYIRNLLLNQAILIHFIFFLL
jgi:predicted acylesterase/phospholipase RssA